MDKKNQPITPVSSNFKLFTLIILFLLISTQIITVYFSIIIIPGIISVFSAFVCLSYLWIAELLDRERLFKTNIELILTQSMLKEVEVDIIMSLVLSQEAKDRYTHGHSRRVTKYSVEIAKELGLSNDEIEVINRAGKLHDIGKIGIKDDILFYEGKLNEEQYNIIKTHPIKGANIIEPLKFLGKEKDIVRHHHERYDGEGYPDRLKAEEIPLGARIMAVADAFDAMKSTRPYKKPFSKEEIILELKDNAGEQFDSQIVDVFLKIIDRFYD
ncbi:MAG: HD-GYP domain-containing protein [Candidatus Omnitrophica bacterium]|nr:HD-GYP domain-containing protein [Candidatus Omnitrophota bacterium]